jgi:tetratricopeptide (TPR) repeat protein
MRQLAGETVGRPERSLDYGPAPVRELAQALRSARRAAGSPPYRQMSAVAHFSAATLARAAAGRVLPSRDVTLAYARACGGDPAEWDWRWRRTRAAIAAGAVSLDGPALDAQPSDASPPPGPAALHTLRPDTLRPDTLRPAQLPADVTDFTGRADALRRLDEFLPGRRPAQETAVPISVVSGPAGVGKTALALRWGHLAARHFEDGQLHVNLRGYAPTPPMEPGEALGRFLRALGITADRIPAEVEESADMFRSLLAGKRMLVVLDNAASPEQVRPLVPGSPGCMVVVTSRDRLTGLAATHGVHRLPLDVLAPDDAATLLGRLLGDRRVAAEQAAAGELAALCGRLPLALRIAAANLADRPASQPGRIAAYTAELRDGDRLLALQVPGDERGAVRAAFDVSLTRLSPAGRRMFRLLGLIPGPDLTAEAAAALAGAGAGQAREALAELTQSHLLDEQPGGRFALHDLLSAYATGQASALGGAADRRAPVGRVLDYYLHTAYTAALLLNPARQPLPLPPPQPGAAPGQLTGPEQARGWFEAERSVLLALIAHAAGTGFDRHAWQLAWALADFLHQQGHWHDWASSQQTALAAARRLADADGQARAHQYLGYALARLGRYEDGLHHLQQALARFRELAQRGDEAHVLLTLAVVSGQQDRHDEALRHAELALAAYQAAGHRAGEANALNAVGWSHAMLGSHVQAIGYCSQALALHRERGNPHGAAATWDSLGYSHQQLGQYGHAVACYQQAISLRPAADDWYNHATTLTHLGDAQQADGNRPAAREAWQQAVGILDKLRHPDAAGLRTRLERLG